MEIRVPSSLTSGTGPKPSRRAARAPGSHDRGCGSRVGQFLQLAPGIIGMNPTGLHGIDHLRHAGRRDLGCSVFAVALRRIASGERIGPGVHGDPERPAGQLLYVTLGDPRRNGRIARLSVIRSPDRGGGEVGTTAELGAGERIRTADLPFTRSTASCNMRATCADDTDHRTDGTHHAGIIWRAGPRTGPQPRRPFPAVLLLCVTSPRAPIRPGRAGSAAQIRPGFTR